MPRPNRGRVSAGIYHVWRRTTGPVAMFEDDLDRTDFCNRLADAVERFAWVCLAFVLMPTHFHFVLDVDDDRIQPGMHRLWACYAQQFNRRWGRSGHLRAEPYKLRPVEDEGGLMVVVRYVARNPVVAGLCERPQDWVWSSYPGSAGYGKPFPFVDESTVLACFHEDRAKAIQQLRIFVETD